MPGAHKWALRRKSLIVVFGVAGDSAVYHQCLHVGVPWSQGKPSLIVVFGVAGDCARANKCRHVGVPRYQGKKSFIFNCRLTTRR
jgi:hypothetical protein